MFDQVSFWRCDFAPFDEVVAFVGHVDGAPLAACDIDDSRIKRSFVEGNDHDDIYETLNPQTALLYYVRERHGIEGTVRRVSGQYG